MKTPILTAVLTLIYLFSSSSGYSQAIPNNSTQAIPRFKLRSIPRVLKGVTLEDVQGPAEDDSKGQRQYDEKIAPIIYSLQKFAELNGCDQRSCLSTRVVFDFKSNHKLPGSAEKYLNAVNYKKLIGKLHDPAVNSVVLGEILDSDSLEKCNLDCYRARVDNYLSVLGESVDIWEVGNEVNGNWTGKIEKTIQKINYAAQAVKDRGGRTALTLFYDVGCSKPKDKYELNKWLDERTRSINTANIDYVLLSFYENACDQTRWQRPTHQDWQNIFDKIRTHFRSDILIGFSETGIADNEDGTTPFVPPDRKKDLINHYYSVTHRHFATHPQYKDQYVGGYYWWQFNKDMVPYTDDQNSLWWSLNNAWRSW